jgi:hypothetical protein
MHLVEDNTHVESKVEYESLLAHHIDVFISLEKDYLHVFKSG